MHSKILFVLLLVPAVLGCGKKPPPPNEKAREDCKRLLPAQRSSSLRWQSASNGNVPRNAISAGTPQGCYVGRVGHGGDLIPGKVCPRNKAMYISHGGKEFVYKNYDVLVNLNGEEVQWVAASGGHIPHGGVPQSDSCNLFICRNHWKPGNGGFKGQNIHVPGYVDYRSRVCHTPYFGGDRRQDKYDILVNKVPAKYFVTKVKYQLNQAKVIEMEPASLATTYVENNSRSKQTIWKTVSYKKSETRTWQHTFGVRLGVEVHVTAGIPFIFETGIRVSAETSYTGQWGRATTVTKGFETTVQLDIPGRHRTRVRVLARQGVLDVPYTATVRTEFRDGRSTSKTISGWFKNVNHYDVRVDYDEATPIP